MFRITMRERGNPAIVSLANWRADELEVPMRELEELGIVRITYSSEGVMITPTVFVGCLTLPSYRLEILPKNPAMLSVVRDLVTDHSAKEAPEYEYSLKPSNGNETMSSFLQLLTAVVDLGVPWAYDRSEKVTSFPVGAIDFGRTIDALAIRGIRHQVVVSSSERRQNPVFARVVMTASQYLFRQSRITAEQLVQADTLMEVFEPHPLFDDIDEAISSAESLVTEAEDLALDGLHVDLIQTCISILSGTPLLGESLHFSASGTAYFQNLESIWESCVHRLLLHWCAGRQSIAIELHGLSKQDIRLFQDGGPVLDPDVIIRKNSKVAAIVDAKYKGLSRGAPPAADLYQIAAYVRSTNASLGLLVYYSETVDQLQKVGTTEFGAPIYSIALTAKTLEADGVSALSNLLDGSGVGDSLHD